MSTETQATDQAAQTAADEVRRVVARMGGPTRVAEFFGIRQPAVSQWLANGCLPRARKRHLQDVRPDLFEPSPASGNK